MVVSNPNSVVNVPSRLFPCKTNDLTSPDDVQLTPYHLFEQGSPVIQCELVFQSAPEVAVYSNFKATVVVGVGVGAGVGGNIVVGELETEGTTVGAHTGNIPSLSSESLVNSQLTLEAFEHKVKT